MLNLCFQTKELQFYFGYEYEQMADGQTALIIRFTLQAKRFLGASINEDIESIKGKHKDKLKASFSLNLVASADINVKYNCLTNTWSLNENAGDQTKALHEVKQNKNLKVKGGLGFGPPPPEVKNGEAFIEGDMIRTDLKVEGIANIIGELKKNYELIQFHSELSISGKISSFMGIERVIGFDTQKGPFTQERIYFSGLQYEVTGKVKLKWFGMGVDEDFEDKGNFLEPFDYKTQRMYIMQTFK